MKIGILGAGNVGSSLAALFAEAGHEVVAGVRDVATSTQPESFSLVTAKEAAEFGELVVIAVPFVACSTLLPELATSLVGKVVVDATNPLHDDWSPLPVGEENSAGETVARLLPQSKVVKAFNTIFADIMNRSGLDRDGHAVTAFVAGDHDDANAAVANLAEQAGFAPKVAGPLRMARYLESMVHLNIYIAVGLEQGTDAAFLYR